MKNIVDIKKFLSIVSVFLLLISFSTKLFAQNPATNQKPMKYWTQAEFEEWENNMRLMRLAKPGGAADRREGIMDGNKIRTVFYNYGSIGRPNTEPSIEWPKESNHGYAYEFGPMIGAQVVDIHGDTIAIFSDGLIDSGDKAPSGKVWGWQPLPQYLNTNAATPAMSNNPDSWPRYKTLDNPFYNPDATSAEDEFIWPGINKPGQVSGDLEAYWVMDDRDNNEFEYYPFANDSTRRGLGLEVTCRLIQFSATPAEDVIFYIIEIKNVSDKRLDKVVAGMFGDPHIGGSGDFSDDMAGFEPEKNMVYSWDMDGSSNDWNIPWNECGWLGFKFLESPKDADGNELGLTSMTAPVYATAGGAPASDDVMWEKMTPGLFDEENIAQQSDNVFLFGTGYFKLDPGETQRFSIAIIMGKGKQDLLVNGEVALDIYNRDYQFTKAPNPPKVTAIPGDGKVTLYWDSGAENSFDDFFQVHDFEGYKLYKSTDKGLSWGEVITNAYGLEVGYLPVEQWDVDDDVKDLFPYDKDGVKFYLGKNSGLVHSYVDENVINGVTYYYAVTSYDSGYVSKAVHPVESGKFQGLNMVNVMPTPRVPGYENAGINAIKHTEGFSTSDINIEVIDPQLIEGHSYEISFEDTSSGKMVVNMVDLGTNKTVLSRYEKLDGYPVIVDGLTVSITNETLISVMDSLSGWAAGASSTLELRIGHYSGGLRIPRDFEIRFYDSIVDTAALSKIPVNFKVRNTNDDVGMDFMFLDKDKNKAVSIGDEIVPILNLKPTWSVKLLAPTAADTVLPGAGDVINIIPRKPFENIDRYVVETQPAFVETEKAKTEFMDKVAVVPNPYIVSSSYETPPVSVFSAGRGERRIYFMYIPPKCTIRIYTLSGELLRVLEHNDSLMNGTEPWDLLTSEGLDISYGIYVYHIDAGEYGEKVGKFAIIK
jgi:hypothetical protein